jgi:hypothetical protein
MRKEILDLMTNEEREMYIKALSCSVILYKSVSEYDTELSYNILNGGNLDPDEEDSAELEEKMVVEFLNGIEPLMNEFKMMIKNQ